METTDGAAEPEAEVTPEMEAEAAQRGTGKEEARLKGRDGGVDVVLVPSSAHGGRTWAFLGPHMSQIGLGVP